MAINLIPFDLNRTMTEIKATKSSAALVESEAIARLRNERAAVNKAGEQLNANLAQSASKPNRRKRKGSKQQAQQDDFGLYTNRQDGQHGLVREAIDNEEHQVDIEV